VGRVPAKQEAAGVPMEVTRLRMIATGVAAGANSRWTAGFQSRKLTIANGQGIVRGNYYHLQDQYGISLKPFA
jgi:hypothetical protein